MMLDLRELAVLRSVIEKGSVTAAALALNVSQPAVSRTLVQIESRLGMGLFRREKQRLYPTREAELLYADVVQALTSAEAVGRRARDLREGRSGALRIASIAAFANSIVPRAVALFQQRMPDIEFAIDVVTAREVGQRVAQSRADIGLLIEAIPVAGIKIHDLCTSPFGCVLTRNHAFAGKKFVQVEQLASERLICLHPQLPLGSLAHRLFEKRDLSLRPSIEVSQSSVACALVQRGSGIALLDKLSILAVANPEAFAFVALRPEENIVGRVVLPAHGSISSATSEFAGALQQTVRDIAQEDPSFGGSANF
jgi:DNA-binding transcriptional LysR family regulator